MVSSFFARLSLLQLVACGKALTLMITLCLSLTFSVRSWIRVAHTCAIFCYLI